jgi:hypothetical protein
MKMAVKPLVVCRMRNLCVDEIGSSGEHVPAISGSILRLISLDCVDLQCILPRVLQRLRGNPNSLMKFVSYTDEIDKKRYM